MSSSTFSALHVDGYVYASPSKSIARDDLSDSDDDTALMDAYNQAVERYRETHDPNGAVAGATALSPVGARSKRAGTPSKRAGTLARDREEPDDAPDPSPVAWPRGDQPLVRDDDDDDDGRPPSGSRARAASSRPGAAPHPPEEPSSVGGAMREWNEMTEREREAAWADYYASSRGGTAGGGDHRRRIGRGEYRDPDWPSASWTEWDAYHRGDYDYDYDYDYDHGRYERHGRYGYERHGRYGRYGHEQNAYGGYPLPPPPRRHPPPPPPPRHPYESYHVRGDPGGYPAPPGTPPTGHRRGDREERRPREERATPGAPPSFGGEDAAGAAREAARAALRFAPGGGGVHDADVDELANLLMSWYYAGYYTGSYSRRPGGGR